MKIIYKIEKFVRWKFQFNLKIVNIKSNWPNYPQKKTVKFQNFYKIVQITSVMSNDFFLS